MVGHSTENHHLSTREGGLRWDVFVLLTDDSDFIRRKENQCSTIDFRDIWKLCLPRIAGRAQGWILCHQLRMICEVMLSFSGKNE